MKVRRKKVYLKSVFFFKLICSSLLDLGQNGTIWVRIEAEIDGGRAGRRNKEKVGFLDPSRECPGLEVAGLERDGARDPRSAKGWPD